MADPTPTQHPTLCYRQAAYWPRLGGKSLTGTLCLVATVQKRAQSSKLVQAHLSIKIPVVNRFCKSLSLPKLVYYFTRLCTLAVTLPLVNQLQKN